MNQPTPIVVIAGLGTDGKPHAAQFAQEHIKQATKAARLMSFSLGLANTETALAVAKSLPRGKIYDSGRAFAPLVKHATFQQLQQVLTLEKLEPLPEEKQPSILPMDPWEHIKIGSVALYGGKYVDEGWWEIVVTKVSKDGEVITGAWRGSPKEKPVQCRRYELAVLGREALKSLRKM